MALPSSGVISLNQIHVEVGGNSATLCSINDADIRALASSTLSTGIDFADFYGLAAGAAATSDTQTITVGEYNLADYTWYGNGSVYGSISDGTFDMAVGEPSIGDFNWSNVSYNGFVTFRVNKGNMSKSDFTSVDIGGTTFDTVDSTFSTTSSQSSWLWKNVSTSPFGTTDGATVTASFS